MKKLNNLHMIVRAGMTGVGWYDRNGHRYHIWLQTEADKPVTPYAIRPEPKGKPILYVNPPGDIGRYDPGYFQSRRLDATAKANAALVAEALRRAEAEGLYEQAVAANEAEERERLARERAERLDRARSALRERRERHQASPATVALIDALLAAADDALLAALNL